MGTAIIDKKPDMAGGVTLSEAINNKTLQTLAAVIVLALIVVYRTTFSWEWAMWMKTESEYSHGPIIPLMSAFIVWFNWKELAKTNVKPCIWGLPLIIVAIFVQFAGHRSAGFSMAGFSLPPLLLGASLMLFGVRVTKGLLIPILFLFFMLVPPWSLLSMVSNKIQLQSTVIATKGLQLLGYNAVREGQFIHIEDFKVQVAAACSGIRTLVMMLAFGTFMSYMLKGPLWGRLMLIAMIGPLALITNSVRVLVVAMVGYSYGKDWMTIVHDYGGYVIVFMSMGLLYLLAKVVKCRDFRSMPSS